ncbi:MAG: helix-turn-helix domain-containing protein [Chloroflexi bacterium]|nr:helix-turn-helix domain-containing protein [Chloroflexota bacterium]
MQTTTGFGEALRARREAAGVSQSGLAKRVGLDASYVNRLESGQRGVERRETVLAMARALEVDPGETDRLLVAAGFLPEAIHILGVDHPALALVARALTAPTLTDAERAEFQQVVEAIARRWLGLPARE